MAKDTRIDGFIKLHIAANKPEPDRSRESRSEKKWTGRQGNRACCKHTALGGPEDCTAVMGVAA